MPDDPRWVVPPDFVQPSPDELEIMERVAKEFISVQPSPDELKILKRGTESFLADLPLIRQAKESAAHKWLQQQEALASKSRPGAKPYNRAVERGEILQAVADVLNEGLRVSRKSLSSKLSLSVDGFDDKRERCSMKLDDLQALTLADLRSAEISPK